MQVRESEGFRQEDSLGWGRPHNAGSEAKLPAQFKREAVRLVRSSPGNALARIAKELGVSDNSLRSWIKQTQIDQGEREGLLKVYAARPTSGFYSAAIAPEAKTDCLYLSIYIC